jgi:hypothetical protein
MTGAVHFIVISVTLLAQASSGPRNNTAHFASTNGKSHVDALQGVRLLRGAGADNLRVDNYSRAVASRAQLVQATVFLVFCAGGCDWACTSHPQTKRTWPTQGMQRLTANDSSSIASKRRSARKGVNVRRIALQYKG